MSKAILKQSTSNMLLDMEHHLLVDVRENDNEEIKVSRIGVYIRKYVKQIRKKGLKNGIDAMCWLDLMKEGNRKLSCGFIYREFHLLGQLDSGLIEE